jgi:unsaturated chondroitin disaccharide hydrolase
MIKINTSLTPKDLLSEIDRFWSISGEKILSIEQTYKPEKGTPVFTVNGKYSSRGWTEWTQGFVFGSAILQFDATGDHTFLEIGRKRTLEHMAAHISHIGVHDHGFNNVSTYGNLLRLMREGKIAENTWEREFYSLALKISGAVQASRWTSLPDGGFIHSFNGPHSLFIDTIRSCRALMISHGLGHVFLAENDLKINLLQRALDHMLATAQYAVYYGEGRDSYDIWGRTAHESVFNTKDGNYRCPNSQQGYTGFSTWTRGLAWAMLGFAEELEFLKQIDTSALGTKYAFSNLERTFLKAAQASCDFYIENTPTCGIPYWDTGAPGLVHLGNYLDRVAEPLNAHEPVDSSAAAIAAQGLLRLGKYLGPETEKGKKYWQAGFTVAQSLMSDKYLSLDPKHQGLILHSIYHRPNGWDHVPAGSKIPYGESSQWGDYHARELMLYLGRIARDETYYTFFNCL